MTGKSLTSISLSFILQPSLSHFYPLAANSVAGQGKDSQNLHSKKNFLWKVTNSNSSEWQHRVRADPEGNWYFLQVLQIELAPSVLLSQTPAWNQYLLQQVNTAEKKLVKGQYFSTSKGHKLQVLQYHNVLVSQHIF